MIHSILFIFVTVFYLNYLRLEFLELKLNEIIDKRIKESHEVDYNEKKI